MTWVSAALVKLTACIGVYWTRNEMVYPANAFRTFACAELAAARRPFDLWVRVVPFAEDGAEGRKVGCITAGLVEFVGKEIEFVPALISPDRLVEQVRDIVDYLLVNGPVLKDGDTLGYTADEHIRIRHRDHGRRVAAPTYELDVM